MAFMSVVLPEFGMPTRQTVNSLVWGWPADVVGLILLMAAPYRACIRSRSFNQDPRGFTLPKSQERASHADDQRVTERRSVGDDNVFSRSEPEIEQPIAVLRAVHRVAQCGTIDSAELRRAALPVWRRWGRDENDYHFQLSPE